MLCLMSFLLGAGRGFSTGDNHGGGLSQLHQVPHVCLQFPHLCEYFFFFISFSKTLNLAVSEVCVNLMI